MKITKEAVLHTAGMPSEEQLAKINKLTKSPLSKEQVYVFSLRLCDDQPDRDFECFDKAALEPLAQLFLGKTGIMDHNWAAQAQVARIFQAETVTEGEVSYIKAWAYIRRGEENTALIQDIEAGIKKEVSVGCAMGGSVCSICGAPYGSCGHVKGQEYEGKVCMAVLVDPKDAYEFSFVAVPAQRQAGILKSMEAKDAGLSLKALVEKQGGAAAAAEFYRLSKQAELGKQFEKKLRGEVLRLSLALDLGIPEEVLKTIADKLDASDLEQVQEALAEKETQMFPVTRQLPQCGRETDELDSDFLI